MLHKFIFYINFSEYAIFLLFYMHLNILRYADPLLSKISGY